MSPCAVELRDLSVSHGVNPALEAVSFSLDAGAYLAIVGPNGGGKTTLLRVLCGLIRPERGEARVLGAAPAQLAPERVGYVPQVKTLDRSFPALAIELVVSGLRRRWPARLKPDEEEKGRAALAEVGAEPLARRSIQALSGGELQRIYLARALVKRPELIVLDEPATSLDAEAESDFYRNLENYQRQSGATVVMVTHDWGIALHHASRVLLLNRKVVDFGPPSKALGDRALSRAFGHVGHAHAMSIGGSRNE
jgi:zinc transport system ATP-binding protein